jgi:hypothetical protein
MDLADDQHFLSLHIGSKRVEVLFKMSTRRCLIGVIVLRSRPAFKN